MKIATLTQTIFLMIYQIIHENVVFLDLDPADSRAKTPSPYSSSKDTHSHDSGIGSIEKHGKAAFEMSHFQNIFLNFSLFKIFNLQEVGQSLSFLPCLMNQDSHDLIKTSELFKTNWMNNFDSLKIYLKSKGMIIAF